MSTEIINATFTDAYWAGIVPELAQALLAESETLDPADFADDESCLDVRLQVYPTGGWYLRVGLSDYDQDHYGYWGASCIMPDLDRPSAEDLAVDLVEQAREHWVTERMD